VRLHYVFMYAGTSPGAKSLIIGKVSNMYFRKITGAPVAQVAVCVLLMAAMGCELQTQKTAAPQASVQPDSFQSDFVRSDPAYRMTRSQIISDYSEAVCDPLYTNPEVPTDTSVMRGWFGEIRVPPKGYHRGEWETHLDRFMQPDAVLLSAPLYLQNLDVPTRRFTEGFPTMSGGLVKDDAGLPLIEHFHFNLESGIVLGDLHAEGEYEFAVLSDDGVRLEINDETYLESTGVHPTKLVCGSEAIALNRRDINGLRVQYFQGPRHHIALQLLWRRVTPDTKIETLCNHSGNESWFDYSGVTPMPKQKYRELQSRGWSVVPASSFVLPGYEPLNPCLSERVKEVLAEEKQ
jgi:hypothetical protein